MSLRAILSSQHRHWHVLITAIFFIILLGAFYALPNQGPSFLRSDGTMSERDQETEFDEFSESTLSSNAPLSSDLGDLGGLPVDLFESGLYSASDFANEKGVTPTFWSTNQSCTDFGEGETCRETWGPCYPPKGDLKWHEIFRTFSHQSDLEYPLLRSRQQSLHHNSPDKWNYDNFQPDDGLDYDNFCRPGFLIIGQGKCGTSSLYHYLAGHPRVLPASEKQIHYFKYYANRGLKWYMGHFPSTRSFMAKGALMTGEASPGYLPYPNVVALIRQQMSGTKIICVGRDPLDRSWSSYRYNYVHPAIEKMHKGKVQGILRGQPEAYYKQFLYSFEEMMRAELKVLRECFETGGYGENATRNMWGNKPWAKDEYARREKHKLPPMIDLDGQCYGDTVSKEVPRRQWTDLVAEKPGMFLHVPNMHLSQAMIGRSLYVYPLEWWYAMFPEQDIYFLCTEEMRDTSGDPINDVGQFLGLPSYNFSVVVSEGMYNVGGHKGYDKVTSWKTVEKEHEGKYTESKAAAVEEEIPLSDEFRKELQAFFKPHNERLFELVGRRCDWSS